MLFNRGQLRFHFIALLFHEIASDATSDRLIVHSQPFIQPSPMLAK